jgi:tetratricopeptide (TPR) repeat protein
MIERYTEAIAADESFPDAYVERGAELYFEGWIDEAKADMRKAFALQPTEPDRYLTMSYPFEGEEQRNILKKGMELGAPEFIEYQTLRMMYIQTFWYQGDFAEYVRLLLEWIPQLDPNDFMYRNQLEELASGYSALGQHQNAEAAYRTALVASADASERQSISQMIVRTRMHRNQYNDALATLPEFADTISADELSVLRAVLLVLASRGSEEAKVACMAALPAAELLGKTPGPLGGSTSYYSFLLGIVYAGAERTDAARALLIRFADESAANRREWGVTLRWEIAKARELASLLTLEGVEV